MQWNCSAAGTAITVVWNGPASYFCRSVQRCHQMELSERRKSTRRHWDYLDTALLVECREIRTRRLYQREVIPLLEAACKGTWDVEIRLQCGWLLLATRMFSNFTDSEERGDNIWGVITLLTDLFVQPPSDGGQAAKYWDLQARGWSFIKTFFIAHPSQEDIESWARSKVIHAAEAFEQLNDPLSAARWWIWLAVEDADTDQKRAAEFLERARPAMESIGELQLGDGAYYNACGLVARTRGDYCKALEAFAHAAEIYQRSPREFDRYTAKLPLANRALLLMDLKRWLEAYEDLSLAIVLEERYLDKLPPIPQDSPMTPFESAGAVTSSFTQPIYSDMSLTCQRLERIEESFNWSERSRASNLRRQIGSTSSEGTIVREACGLDGLRHTLGDGNEWVFIQYLVRDRETLAYVVTSDSIDVVELSGANGAVGELGRLEVELDGQRLELEKIIGTLSGAKPKEDVLNRWDRALRLMGERIFAVLLEPILAKQNVASMRRLVLSANGGLERVPWNLAVWWEGGEQVHIIDRFTVRKAISASVMRLMASRRAKRLAGLVVAGSHLELPFVTLEGSEVEAVMRNWLGDAAMVADVGPTELVAAMASRSHIHLACHGDFDEFNPLQTRLILSSVDPGITIRIGDILRAPFESGCAVVLSACETGMLHPDPGGEHLSLPAAFALAGASAVIGSAWPVGDLPTFMLMTRFYDQWRQFPKDPAAALGNAQGWLRDRSCKDLAADLDMLLQRHHGQTTARMRLMCSKLRRSAPTRRPFVSPRHWAGFETFA